MDNLADWYSGGMAPPMVAGSGLLPRPIPSAAGSTVNKTFTTRLGQDVPSSQAALAINGMFGRGLPQTAMAFAPIPVSGESPQLIPAVSTAIPAVRTMTTTAPRGGGKSFNTLATPQNGLAGLFGNLGSGHGLLSLLLGQGGQQQGQGGLLGMMFGNRGAADNFRAAMTGQSAKPQRITAPGGGGAFIARAGSPASDAGAGSGSLLPASMNSTRWQSGY